MLPSAIMNPHDANRAFWDASAEWWRAKEDVRGLWRRAAAEPSCVFTPAEMPFVRDVAGKSVCVLGSGDNEAVFAFAGLGGVVTSVDISARRLEIAAERASTLGLTLSFVRADVTDLAPLDSESFDLVYTGGHVSIWVSDIAKYYAEGARIVKRGGTFIVNEYHPIRRMWTSSDGSKPAHRYFDRGPYPYESTFEYHWTVSDHIQAVVDAGCRIVHVEEHGEGMRDEYWTAADLDSLPACLLIVGTK
jgi:ubiquinone/menaquinone biosynthesis C-methylase UbiE